jgi:deoxyribose-phosphate aldolase
MPSRLDELAKTIDLTLLDPVAGADDVERVAGEAREHHVASVCVLPEAVADAAGWLRGADVKVCAVIGFPLGAAETRAKVAAAGRAVREGAGEIELVLDVRAMLANDFRLVRNELQAVERAVRLVGVNGGRGRVLLKAALETARLDDKRQRLACVLVESARFDFAVTSSADGSATAPHDVERLRECLPEGVGVKAAAGVGDAADVHALLAAGAGRIGLADARAVIESTVGEPV